MVWKQTVRVTSSQVMATQNSGDAVPAADPCHLPTPQHITSAVSR